MGSEIRFSEYGKIVSYYTRQKLENLCLKKVGIQTGPFGSQLHKEDYVTEGTPIITVEHLAGNRIIHENLPLVSDEDKQRLSKYHLQTGDIVFSRVGSVDRNALVGPDEDGWLFSGRCLRVRVDKAQISSSYLAYFLSHEGVKEHIRSIAVGATMPSINTKILSDVIIYYPPLPEQKAIAHILGSLDDKIELNRRMNATLEGMTQALFKSWFVDFDPVIDNALAAGNPIPEELAERAEVRRKALADGTANREAAKQFPATFQLSEGMGWIPEGWEIQSFNDAPLQIIDGNRGKNYPKRTEFTQSGHCLFLNAGNVTPRGFNFSSTDFISFERDELLRKGKLKREDIVLTTRGTVGNFAYYDKDIPFENLRINSGMVILRSSPEAHYSLFLFQYLKSAFFKAQVKALTSGSAQPQLPIRDIRRILIVSPNKEQILLAFTNSTASILEKATKQAEQSRGLTKLRDILLPKLISGELRIPEAEKLTEEAVA